MVDTNIIQTSVSTVFAVCLAMLIGGVCSIFPRYKGSTDDDTIFPRTLLSQMSAMTNNVTFPCLICYTVGKSLSFSLLAEAYPLMIYCCLLSLLSAIVAHSSYVVFRLPLNFKNEFAALVTMGNSGKLRATTLNKTQKRMCSQTERNIHTYHTCTIPSSHAHIQTFKHSYIRTADEHIDTCRKNDTHIMTHGHIHREIPPRYTHTYIHTAHIIQ